MSQNRTRVAIKGLDDLVGKTRRLQTAASEIETRIEKALADAICVEAVERCPVDTGRLRSRIEVREHEEEGGAACGIWPDSAGGERDYSWAVVFGTHDQRPNSFLQDSGSSVAHQPQAELAADLRPVIAKAVS